MEIIALQITPGLAFFLNEQRMSSTSAEVIKAEVLQRTGTGNTADVSVTFRIPAGKIYVDVFSVRWDELERLGGLTGVEAEPYSFKASDVRVVSSTMSSNISPTWVSFKNISSRPVTLSVGDGNWWELESPENRLAVERMLGLDKAREAAPVTSKDIACSDTPPKRAIEL